MHRPHIASAQRQTLAKTPVNGDPDIVLKDLPQAQHMLAGEVNISTRPHTLIGAGVTAKLYLPLSRTQAWQKLTHYPDWIHYFPDITHSKVLPPTPNAQLGEYRLYQVARKACLFLSVQVEIYLKVIETLHQRIQFRFERGSFHDFSADLTLQDYGHGTLLTYSVQATPLIPVPSLFIQEAIRHDLPGNLRKMRQALCPGMPLSPVTDIA